MRSTTLTLALALLVAPASATFGVGDPVASTSTSSASAAAGTSNTASSSPSTPSTAVTSAAAPIEVKPGLTFTALTKPLPLYPGEVTNTWHHIAIPPGPVAISEFAADVVEKNENGELVPVPLGDAYLHHHVVYSSHAFYAHQKKFLKGHSSNGKQEDVNRGVGFGAGTESRGTRQVFPYPYRFTTVEGEDELVANVHVINTRSMPPALASHCLECPCTEQDYAPLETSSSGWHWPWRSSGKSLHNRDVTAPTKLSDEVIERRHHWDKCNAQLRNESNTACSPDGYQGGLICCEHGEFCLDDYFIEESEIPAADKKTGVRSANPDVKETQSVYYLRYTLTYEPLTKDNATDITSLYLAACCDATGNLTTSGNIEYDIPKLCESGGNCTHTLTTVQELHGASDYAFGAAETEHEVDAWVDVVYMVGHLHRGGRNTSAFFENGTLLCESLPRYGTGKPGEIGNEPGYINAMGTCSFDPPLRMKTTDKLTIVGTYNASEAHTGVMSLFYIAVADVVATTDGDGISATTSTTATESIGFFGRFQRLAIVAAFAIVVMAALKVYKKQHTREGYEQVGTSLVV